MGDDGFLRFEFTPRATAVFAMERFDGMELDALLQDYGRCIWSDLTRNPYEVARWMNTEGRSIRFVQVGDHSYWRNGEPFCRVIKFALTDESTGFRR